MSFIDQVPLGNLADLMGIKITEFTEERAVAVMPVTGNTQYFGNMHGGAYVVIGETLGSMHATFMAPENMVAVGVDVNATHTGAATSGHVTAVCTPIHLGRSLAVHETVITNEAGRRCSTVRITNFYKTASPGQ